MSAQVSPVIEELPPLTLTLSRGERESVLGQSRLPFSRDSSVAALPQNDSYLRVTMSFWASAKNLVNQQGRVNLKIVVFGQPGVRDKAEVRYG